MEQTQQKTFVSKDLAQSLHVFPREESPRTLRPPYRGRFKVIDQNERTHVQLLDKSMIVSLMHKVNHCIE